jgi:hypothetical protein
MAFWVEADGIRIIPYCGVVDVAVLWNHARTIAVSRSTVIVAVSPVRVPL